MYRRNPHSFGMYKTPACRAWEEEVLWKVRAFKPLPKEVPVAMFVRLYYKNERDIDSSQKALQDVLQGYLYEDDKQITLLVVQKEKDAKNPRLEVTVMDRKALVMDNLPFTLSTLETYAPSI